jgi:asparagine synthase (glutamine-hydrolysing)
MCGVYGWLGDLAGPSEVLDRMSEALQHRGPDAEGIWLDHGIALGHRRLSILDLSPAGAQPMHSASGRYVLAYNGEIYNHLELRHDLESARAAPQWHGQSDTETLLAGIAHWGLEGVLCRAHGMFALALWDRTEKRLSLARDRMGEKPLYWGWAGSALVFGSELKALRAHPDCPRDVCRKALEQYLKFAYVPSPRSIHPGIFKLEPGCILEVTGTPPKGPPNTPLRPGDCHGSVSIRRYWSLNETLENGFNNQFADDTVALSAVDAALRASVKRQLISDVPLGAFLSGGIDSSLIVALMQEQSSRPVRTFTVGFEAESYNEAPFAAAIAKHLNTEHTELIVTEAEARDIIPFLPELYDEPFADSSQIPTHLVCRAARAHVTVALSGDAGDELFGGYNRYVWAPRVWGKLGWIPFGVRQQLGKTLSTVPASMWNTVGALTGNLVSRPDEKAHKLASRLGNAESLDGLYRNLVSEWTGQVLVPGVGGSASSLLDDPLPSFLGQDPSALMMAQDMRSYLPDDILCKVDRAAMGVSLETRVPFLDPSIVELSARLPTEMKIRNGQGKWVLRQLLDRRVPRDLFERPKTGFGIPVGAWLRGPLKDWADDLLSEASLAKDGLLDPKPIRLAWHEHLSGRRDWTQRLWIVLMFQAWRKSVS